MVAPSSTMFATRGEPTSFATSFTFSMILCGSLYYSVVSIPAGFTAVGTDGSLTVTAGVNSSGKAVSGTLVLGLDADPEKKVEIALSQAAVDEEEGGE